MESLIDYKKILIYIKENGIYDIEKILNDYDNLCSEKKENIILEDLLGSDLLQKLYIFNYKFISYLIDNDINLSIFEEKFKRFINEIKNNINNIDIYLNNIEYLIDNGITSAEIYSKKNNFYLFLQGKYENIGKYLIDDKTYYIKQPILTGIRKIYTDGTMNFYKKNIFGDGTIENPYFIFGGYYNYYYLDVILNNWILDVYNDESINEVKLYLANSFNLNLSNFPSMNEIKSLEVPKCIRNYQKELILKKSK